MATKKSTARVARAARSDASVETIERQIAKSFGLPPAAIKLVRPNGRKFRSDATIEAVLRTWAEA